MCVLFYYSITYPFYFWAIKNLYFFQYAVVTFLPNDEDNELTSDVIPTCWLLAENTKAYWPNFSKRGNTDKRSKLILSLAEPDKSWPIYDVKFRHSYGKCSRYTHLLIYFFKRRVSYYYL